MGPWASHTLSSLVQTTIVDACGGNQPGSLMKGPRLCRPLRSSVGSSTTPLAQAGVSQRQWEFDWSHISLQLARRSLWLVSVGTDQPPCIDRWCLQLLLLVRAKPRAATLISQFCNWWGRAGPPLKDLIMAMESILCYDGWSGPMPGPKLPLQAALGRAEVRSLV